MNEWGDFDFSQSFFFVKLLAKIKSTFWLKSKARFARPLAKIKSTFGWLKSKAPHDFSHPPFP